MGIEKIQNNTDPVQVYQLAGNPEQMKQSKPVVSSVQNTAKRGEGQVKNKEAAIGKAESPESGLEGTKQEQGAMYTKAVSYEPEGKADAESSRKDTRPEDREASKLPNMGTSAEFSYNKDINRIVITISEQGSGKVLKEIPPESTQKMLERIHTMTGMVMDEGI